MKLMKFLINNKNFSDDYNKSIEFNIQVCTIQEVLKAFEKYKSAKSESTKSFYNTFIHLYGEKYYNNLDYINGLIKECIISFIDNNREAFQAIEIFEPSVVKIQLIDIIIKLDSIKNSLENGGICRSESGYYLLDLMNTEIKGL